MAMDFISRFLPDNQYVALFGFMTFVACFALVVALELVRPARRGTTGREGRMSVNFGLGLFNMAVSALLPVSSLAMATLAQSEGWGLLQHWPTAWYAAIPLLLLAKSLLNYWLHRGFHTLSWLWPLHAVHHRDDAIDLSTSFRSHPISHLLLLMPNALLILALGPDIWTTLIAEAVLSFAILFQHANFHISDSVSAHLERWLVTPRMHLVHHARERDLHDSNYGEIFAFWDHLFGTYNTPPQGFMEIGVEPPAKPIWRLG